MQALEDVKLKNIFLLSEIQIGPPILLIIEPWMLNIFWACSSTLVFLAHVHNYKPCKYATQTEASD